MPTILITGANRGLGLEFVRQYLGAGYDVIATCRKPEAAEELNALSGSGSSLEVVAMDMMDFASIEAAANAIGSRPIDILLNNAGVFGPKPKADGDMRQNFGQLDYQLWADILRVNTMAPLKMAETFLENVMAGSERKLITISSLVASITEGGPGLYIYRTSKTALNMAMATLARDLEGSNVIVALFNPGWVRTDMGGSAAVLGVEESIRSVRKVIAGLSVKDSGSFIDYDGRRLPW